MNIQFLKYLLLMKSLCSKNGSQITPKKKQLHR